jgi:uncharacterized protein (DUF1501 family)
MAHRPLVPRVGTGPGSSDVWNRRDLIRLGGLFGMGLTLPVLGRALARGADTAAGPAFGRARSVIMLYLHGGHAQQETWDPKPDGPSATRGEFGAIASNVPGVFVSELLPRSSRIMDRVALIRSLTHGNANHVQASLSAMTGHSHPPGTEARGDFPPSPTDFPAIGAVLDRVRPSRGLPTWVQLGPTMRRTNGTVLHGQSPGFLGSRHGPLVIDQDFAAGPVRVDAISPDPDVTQIRLGARRDLLQDLDDARRALDSTAEVRTLDRFQQRAIDLLTGPETAAAFDLASEPAAVRAAYGPTSFGQSCLLARRLAEAGVPMINVHYCRSPTGWDTHGRHFPQMKDSLCPTLDQAFTALVTDLDRRGRLGQTLVVVNAEFGRTPKINSGGGRDHWPSVYSIALAGAGVTGGLVLGSSDASAAYPASDPYDPADVAATLYHLLGVPASTTLHDTLGRPYPLVIGRLIDHLFA